MALLSPITKIDADLAATTQAMAAHIAVAIQQANTLASRLAGLPADTLQSWLNSRPVADVLALFGAHESLGTALNAASDYCATQDLACGSVDISPFADKLAAHGKAITVDANGFTVTDIPTPEPEPEA